jgi:hypothetical protein
MNKSDAIRLLGGTNSAAAKAIGISSSAVSQWPDVLPPPIEDRVIAAIARRHLPAELLGGLPTADATTQPQAQA